MGALFGGSKPKVVKPPEKNDPEIQKAGARRRLSASRGKNFQSTIMAQFRNELKDRLGA